MLCQQTAVARDSARLLAGRRAASDLAAAAHERLEETNRRLVEAVRVLERSRQIQERLTPLALTGEGLEGLAEAVHDLTGHTVAIEDRWGNLQVWAGPSRPDPYPELQPEVGAEPARWCASDS